MSLYVTAAVGTGLLPGSNVNHQQLLLHWLFPWELAPSYAPSSRAGSGLLLYGTV